MHKIFVTLKNNSAFLIIIFVFMFFHGKQKKKKKNAYGYAILLFSDFRYFKIVLKFQINNGFHFYFSLLQKYPKNDFCNLEIITSCHRIQDITLYKLLVILAVTNLKYKNCQKIFFLTLFY